MNLNQRTITPRTLQVPGGALRLGALEIGVVDQWGEAMRSIDLLLNSSLTLLGDAQGIRKAQYTLMSDARLLQRARRPCSLLAANCWAL